MTDTLLASVDSWVMTEVLSQLALAPMRSRFAVIPFINTSNIDGLATEDRTITKKDDIAEAVDDTEGVTFQEYEEYKDDTPVTLRPTGKVQGVKPSVKSLRRAMPGATRAEVIQAIKSGDPRALPMLSSIAEEIIDAHYRALERSALATASGFSQSGGTTNTAASFVGLLDAQTTLLDTNKPEHRTIVAFLGGKGIGDLRTELINGDAAASNLFSNGYGQEFLNSLGGASPSASTPFGNILGMPILEADSALMPTANAAVDKVGMIICVGRGQTGTPGSMRGALEFCEGHELDVQLAFDMEGDVAKAIGRYEWDLKEHTDEHGVGFIYKAA